METENNQTTPQSKPTGEKVIQPLDPTLKAQPAQPVPASPSNPAAIVTPSPQPPAAPSPETAAEDQYQPSSVPPGYSQSDAIAEESKQARKRRLRMSGIILGGLLVIAVAAALAAPLFFGMKTVTYDNGKGAKFQLKFYARHTVKSAPGSQGLQELASKVSVDGLDPLALNITKATKKPSPSTLNCDSSGSSPALRVANKPTGNTVNICSLGQGQSTKPILYIGFLRSGDNYYAILINQDVDFKQLLSSQQNAQAGLKKIDLSAYNDDITKIVSSIKPLQ